MWIYLTKVHLVLLWLWIHWTQGETMLGISYLRYVNVFSSHKACTASLRSLEPSVSATQIQTQMLIWNAAHRYQSWVGIDPKLKNMERNHSTRPCKSIWLSASLLLAPSYATLLQYRQERLWMDHIFSVKQNIENKINGGTLGVWNLMGVNATFSQWPTKGETPSETPFGYNKCYWLHVQQIIVSVETFCDDIELSSKNTNFRNKRKIPKSLKNIRMNTWLKSHTSIKRLQWAVRINHWCKKGI